MPGDTLSLYPPTPQKIPADLTRLTLAYRLRSAAMLFSLLLFLLFYIALIVGVAYLIYLAFHIPINTRSSKGDLWATLFKFGFMTAGGLLLIFLVKGLFKGQRVAKDDYLEIKRTDAPSLFQFIEQLCRDTGAARPRRVYLSAEVNAAVIFNSSIINLIVPPKKDLLIGLGLVNVLPLHEFKAVLAHEFGHFAQKSAGLGSYLTLANRIMHDIVYSRDGWDRFVDQWAGWDLRVSFPAWGLKGVLWLLRAILGSVLKGFGLLHLSLSRQLEFNADNVAVSVCGSDAIVHSLSRLEFASEALSDAAASLDAAADHGHFSDDLFYHQTQSMHRLRHLKKDQQLGLPPTQPDDPQSHVQVFQQQHDGIPDHLRSHPTNLMRENNAKRIYIRSLEDNRSPWLLFDHAGDIRKAVTEVFYFQGLKRKEKYDPRPAVEIQAFLDAEHAETTYDPKYHGYYDNRLLCPGDLTIVPDASWTSDKVKITLQRWLSDEQAQRIKQYLIRRGEIDLLAGLHSGQLSLKGKTFPFREVQRTRADVKPLLDTVEKELEQDNEYFQQLDHDVFLAHRFMAQELDQQTPREHPRLDELLQRYRFHEIIQGLLAGMFGEQRRLQSVFAYLQGKHELTQQDFGVVQRNLKEIADSLQMNLQEANRFQVPALTNVPAGTTLSQLIMDRDGEVLEDAYKTTISGEWLMKLGSKLAAAVQRVKRVHFKSLGGLLNLQDQLHQEWNRCIV